MAHRVYDIYDDPTASVLRSRLGEKELPAKLASAALLLPEEHQRLPDRLFAMVASHGSDTLRKYAMHDAAHLATSILYFLETRAALPEPMQQKVAANLVNACAWYDTTPPESLVKVALVGALNAGLGVLAVPAKMREEHAKSKSTMDQFRAAQASGTKLAGRTIEVSGEEEKQIAAGTSSGSPAWAALEKYFSGDDSFQAKVDSYGGEYPNAFDGKIANTSGTELAVQGALKNDPRGATPASRMALSPKTSNWEHAGDLTGHKVAEPTKVATATHYALPHTQKYPIDTTSQVKRAAAYFDEHFRAFTDMDRRVFASSLVNRAEELGVKVAGQCLDYGGGDYGSFIVDELEGRVRAFEGTAKVAAYEVLLEKRAEIPAPVMVELLKKADQETGVALSYGRVATGFREPHVAVFGKTAADHAGDPYSWSHKGQYVSEDTLNLYAYKAPQVDQFFGDGFSRRFQRRPVEAFRSLPDDEKVILSRLANAEASRTP